ncbi:hypothetical protein [Riemerella columbipharyngis]|nr:hypothetical protein [Riemerella columbipharyngis]
MKRTILAKEQEKLAEKIKIRQDSIYKRKLQDFAYWTPLTVDADPLWLLYYKRMLKPLKEFPDKLSDWNGFDEEGYKKLYSLGTITRLQENLDLLKNQYEISRTVSMPRGKRFILYHKTLIGWRKFLSNLDSEKKNASLMISYKQREKERKQPSEIYNHQTDMKIAERVFIKYRQLIHNN